MLNERVLYCILKWQGFPKARIYSIRLPLGHTGGGESLDFPCFMSVAAARVGTQIFPPLKWQFFPCNFMLRLAWA